MTELDDALKQALTQGRLSFRNGDYPAAAQHLERFVERNQSFADVYNMLGVAYHDGGHFQKAERAFEAALQLNPAYTGAALSLAVLYNDTGKYQAARDTYRQALSRSGASHERLDRFVQGKLANLYADVAEVWLSAGRYGEAVQEYRRALDLCPGFVDIRARLAAALREAGETEQAISEYQRLLEDAPGFVPGRLALGLSLQVVGRVEEARRQWRAVLELAPGNRSAEMYLKLTGPRDGAAAHPAP